MWQVGSLINDAESSLSPSASRLNETELSACTERFCCSGIPPGYLAEGHSQEEVRRYRWGGAVAVQLGEAEAWELQDGMLQEAAAGWGCLRGNLFRVFVSGAVANKVKQCRGTAVQAHLRLCVLPYGTIASCYAFEFSLVLSSSETTLFGFVDTV